MLKTRSTILIMSFLFLSINSFSAVGIEYEDGFSYKEIPNPNLNVNDIDGESFSISYYKNNELNIMEIQNNSQTYTNLNIAPMIENLSIKIIKMIHILDSGYLFFIGATNQINDSNVGVISKYENNKHVFSTQFLLDQLENFDIFKFNNVSYFYYSFNGTLLINSFNVTNNQINSEFQFDLDQKPNFDYELNDISFSNKNIYLSLTDKLDLGEDVYKNGTVLILSSDVNNSLSVNKTLYINSNVHSVAPLNNSFLLINGTQLYEFNLQANESVMLYEFRLFGFTKKLRALSAQELVFLIDTSLYGRIFVSGDMWRVWDIYQYDYPNVAIIDFEAQYQSRGFVVLGEHYPTGEKSYFLFSRTGIRDLSEFLDSFASASTEFSTVYYPEYVYSDRYIDNGPWFLFFVFTGLIASGLGIFAFKKNQALKTQMFLRNRLVCLHCKSKLEEGSIYCSNCGNKQL